MSYETTPPGQLRRESVLNPITALAFLTLNNNARQYLLAAEDTCIKVFDVATKRLCGVRPVFTAQPIQGISVAESGDRVLVWGGCVVKILSGSGLVRGDDDDDGAEAIAPDWIFDGRISPFEGDRVVLLTAHNEVIQGCVSEDRKRIVLGGVQSPSRPILYSGNFFWVERGVVLVAAGTVFGEIVVWKCRLSDGVEVREGVETGGCEVLHVFSGHQGSIFGVHISPEFEMGNGEKVRLLASCSDDRTIRIWDISEQRDEVANGYETQISDARQTGFGDSITGSVGQVNSQSRCVAMAMGHVSRIWQVEIHAETLHSKGVVEVYSFGEDATVQRWHLEGLEKTSSGSPAAKLTHNETFSNHSGKHIWSHAMLTSPEGLLIASGGGDSKIALIDNDSVHPLSTTDKSLTKNGRSVQEFDISPAYLIEACKHQNLGAAPSISNYKHGNGKEMFQSFTFITDDTLLIITRSGRIFLGTFGSKTDWEELKISDPIRIIIQSYTILRTSQKAATAFIGAPNGELFYYRKASGRSLRSMHKAERKITEIICLSDTWDSSSEGRSEGDIELLVTVFGSTKAELLRLDQHCSKTRQTEVILPREYIMTAAAWCHNYLILGSRNGKIAIYDPTTPEGAQSPLLTIDANVGDKITSILPLPQRSKHSPPYFLTTARDGKYRIYEILNTTNGIQVRLLHETKPPFGPLIEGSWLFDKADGTQDLMLCGFRGKDFVVWNASQQKEVATFDCGGGHRVFVHAQIGANPEGFRFACTKASQMKIFSQMRAPHLPLKTGGHGREIKAVSASGKYVATGAEDTMIRIWELQDAEKWEQQLRCVLALEKHNTGIQTLKWYEDQYLFSSGGNEEFYAWRISALESDVSPLGVVCEAVFPDRSEVGDLRITDFDVHRLEQGALTEEEKSLGEPTFCITMTLSNSAVQSYFYSAKNGFQFLGRRMYTGACLTQLRHLNFTDGRYPQVLTAATDGHIAIFTDVQGTEESTKIVASKIHQSTVKSLDMHTITTTTGTSHLIVTGGDDNALGVLHIQEQQSPPRYEIRNKFILRSAHAAAVTGIGIVRLENEDRDAVVVTSSNDQRVKTWRLVNWQTSSLKMQLVDDRYSGVADAGDLEVVRGDAGERVLVGGVGVEVWRVA